MISPEPNDPRARKSGSVAYPWRWFTTALYASALVLGTHLPDDHRAVATAIEMAGNDRIAHFLAYAGLAFLVFGLCKAARSKLAILVTLAALAAFGAADELTQPWFGRTAEWLDGAADLAGLVLGLCGGQVWLRWGLHAGFIQTQRIG